MIAFLVLFLAAFAAGIQNALAGGGSFLTFPSLLFTGLDARAANITSTIALFPGQVTTAYAARDLVSGLPALSFKTLFILSLVGGIAGALLLLATPVKIFDFLVPWLVLFATAVFAWGAFRKKGEGSAAHLSPRAAAIGQFLISIYGGYFGGGIGILMLAVLTLAGQNVRVASGTKMVLAAAMNASAVLIFLFSPDIAWPQVFVAGVGAIAGGQVGALMIKRVNEKVLRVFVILLGLVLTICLMMRK